MRRSSKSGVSLAEAERDADVRAALRAAEKMPADAQIATVRPDRPSAISARR